MAEKSVEKLFAEILKDYKAVASEAVEKAAIKTQADIIKKANSLLEKYYKGYKPTMYRRKYNLAKAMVPVFESNPTRRKISFTVGIEYDASKLKGVYKSNSWYHQSGDKWVASGLSPSVSFYETDITTDDSFDFDSQNNGTPEPDWILNNYLVGIHPWANRKYKRFQPTFIMEHYIKRDQEFHKRLHRYVEEEFFNVLVSRLQKG